jgi:hypothetical protein
MAWIRDVALLAVVFTVFLAGRNMGRQEIEAKWETKRAQDAEQIASQERDYVQQLQAARDQAVEAGAELARLRAAPHPRLVCRAAPAVPASAPSSGSEPTGEGAFPSDARFDPTERIYADIADAADSAVESCREALATWPHVRERTEGGSSSR